jgi:hypothetical protein
MKSPPETTGLRPSRGADTSLPTVPPCVSGAPTLWAATRSFPTKRPTPSPNAWPDWASTSFACTTWTRPGPPPTCSIPRLTDTQTFSEDSLDKLDYLLAALKKNGIYVYPDLLVHRKFREGDGVADFALLGNGAKGVAHFSRRVIELNKKYAKMLFTHKNPYTGKSLAEDPFFMGTELVNESSIFTGYGLEDFPPAFEAELQKLYQAWGGKGKITRFAWDWSTQSLKAVRNLENAEQSMRFLAATTEATNEDMRQYLRSLGVKSLFTMSNQGLPLLADLRADAKMDHIDTHAYWDLIWRVDANGGTDYAPFDNTSQLLNPFKDTLVFHLAPARSWTRPRSSPSGTIASPTSTAWRARS